MPHSIKEFFSDFVFYSIHGHYNFEFDVLNLPAAALREKYLTLKNDPRFIEKYILPNPFLLHQVINDPEKSLLLLEMGYSLIRLDQQDRTPLKAGKALTIKDKNILLDSIAEIIYKTVNSNKPPVIFFDEIEELIDQSVENKKILLFYLLKRNYKPDEKRELLCSTSNVGSYEFDDNEFYSLINHGLVHEAILWHENFSKCSVSGTVYNIDEFTYQGRSFLDWASFFNDVDAIKYFLEKDVIQIEKDKMIKSALKLAQSRGNKEAIELLSVYLLKDSPINIRDKIQKGKYINRKDLKYANHQDDKTRVIYHYIDLDLEQSRFCSLLKKGTDPFLKNKSGLNAFYYCIFLNKQGSFNSLVDAVMGSGFINRNIYSSDIEIPAGNIFNAKELLNFISGYFKENKNKYTHDSLSFFWKYLALPLYRKSNRSDRMKIIYFFKNLYIDGSLMQAHSEPLEPGLSWSVDITPLRAAPVRFLFSSREPALLIDPEFEKRVLIEVKHLLILHEQQTMLGLNSGISGFGFGASSINAKLEEIVAQAGRLFGDCSGACLSEKAKAYIDDNKRALSASQYEALDRAVKELRKLAQDRSRQYGAAEHSVIAPVLMTS